MERMCSSCGKTEQDNKEKLLKCSRCRKSSYCNQACQLADWPAHKATCTRPNKAADDDSWMDEFRATREGNKGRHMGRLELVTWESVDSDDGSKLGWGAALVDEADELKDKFENEFKGNHKKLFKHWGSAYRWTCCGLSGDEGIWGCDHHGDLNCKPCGCDFCRGGKPLPTRLWKKVTAHKKGLQLRRGPDPRPHSMGGDMNFMLRGMMMGDV